MNKNIKRIIPDLTNREALQWLMPVYQAYEAEISNTVIEEIFDLDNNESCLNEIHGYFIGKYFYIYHK